MSEPQDERTSPVAPPAKGPAPAEAVPAEAAPVEAAQRLRELERSLARLEGQLRGLTERVGDVEGALRIARKRALWFRLGLLVLLLSIYVLVRARYAA